MRGLGTLPSPLCRVESCSNIWCPEMFVKVRRGNIPFSRHLCLLLPLVRNGCQYSPGEISDYTLMCKVSRNMSKVSHYI